MHSDESLLKYLHKYYKEAKVLELSDLNFLERECLPESWINILALNGMARNKAVLKYWDNFKNKLIKVTYILNHNLLSVNLIRTTTYGFSLIYEIESIENDKKIYYEALNPKNNFKNVNLEKKWTLIPDSIKRFYDFHDGFTRVGTGAYGLTPRDYMKFISDDEWWIIEEMELNAFKLDHILTLYSNGSGGYLCVDLSKNDYNFLIWWKDDRPDESIDFWSVLDEWTLFGLE